jgi:serine protease Do
MAPGTPVSLKLLRDGKEKMLSVKLGELPSSAAVAGSYSDTQERLGLSVEELTRELAERLGYIGESGVVVSQVAPGSAAALAGIRPGALIQEVNRKPVGSVEEFRNALEKTASDGTLLLLVRNGQYSRYVALKLAH